MFDKTYEQRLTIWKKFRDSLETSESPIQDTIEFWSKAPLGRLCADPYDKNTWPDPWELILENQYCDFLQILGICYTLKLTDRFSTKAFEIHIALNKKENNLRYLLFVDNQAIGNYNDECIETRKKPRNFHSQMQHTINSLH